jgi:hypothetical protein
MGVIVFASLDSLMFNFKGRQKDFKMKKLLFNFVLENIPFVKTPLSTTVNNTNYHSSNEKFYISF